MNDMLSHAHLRPATVEDSQAIATLMQEGVSGDVRGITIMGSPHLARYVADEIMAQRGDEYVVGTVQGVVVGMCSWRHVNMMLQLNHLYLAADARGQGLGTALVLDGLQRIRRPDESQLSVDVFYDNPRARAWYRSWGMSPEYHVRWIQLPLPSVEPLEVRCCRVAGLEESHARYVRYGFSQFTVSTTTATYQIGRLSHGLFRVSTGAILRDPAALQELTRIDPGRQLLCVGSVEDTSEYLSQTAKLIAESEHLTSSCATIMEHLGSSRPRQRHFIPV